MNPSPQNDPDAIRSDIDMTRRRMDDTMDALGDRLQPQHLLDEILGFFRGTASDGNSRLSHVREKITHSADTALHAVTDTVKKNPVPALLIGAGVAWMIYESRRQKTDFRSGNEDYLSEGPSEALRYDPDLHYDRPLEYPTSSATETEWSGQSGSKVGQIKEPLSDKTLAAAGQLKDKLSHVGEVAREKMDTVRDRASEMTAKLKDGTREACVRTRQRVATTVDQHPLEVGLVALAGGLIAGLMLPTPNAVNRSIGPAADRLRARTREAGTEILEKGKRVAEAAAEAVKEEAEAQGLTPEHLRQKAGTVAERAKEAGQDTARRESLAPVSENKPSGATPTNPSTARPVA